MAICGDHVGTIELVHFLLDEVALGRLIQLTVLSRADGLRDATVGCRAETVLSRASVAASRSLSHLGDDRLDVSLEERSKRRNAGDDNSQPQFKETDQSNVEQVPDKVLIVASCDRKVKTPDHDANSQETNAEHDSDGNLGTHSEL